MKFAEKSRGHMVDLLFTLALFCVFAVSSLLVVIIGANVYKGTVKSMSRNFNIRTSLSYVSEKVRQNDTAGAVYLDHLDGETALVLEQNYNGADYQTWIYHYDGSLMELFTQKGNEVSPSDGQPIMEIPNFTIERQGENLYQLSITDEEGKKVKLTVSPRCT
ncbi:DUF4860 domain-containing protein [Oscillospiraceae bacterium PP1C4]